TGLDVDLWFWEPKAAAKGPLPKADRESIKSRSILDAKAGMVQTEFAPRVAALLRLAASDTRVTRMFVNPVIKRELCATVEGDRAWLNKVRPWYGHDDHFHVRLACPTGDSSCVKQMEVAQGDGCGELNWWFSKQKQEDRAKGQATYQAKVGRAPGMPAECAKLLDGSPAAASDTSTPPSAASDTSPPPSAASDQAAPPAPASEPAPSPD
ncbi:MAG TPA: penicillin-insensitive murein endopeptidase, partial [Polyangiales bacterium]|nr:penicillin-insensitive murein endopeptidase [Polyangiales bacterium]